MLEKSFGKHILALGAAILIVPSAQAQELKDEGDKLSYTIGNSWGKTLKREQIKPNYDILLKAIHDVVDGKPTTMTEDEMRATIQEFTKKQQARREEERKVQEEERKKLGEKSKVEGEEFLAKKAKEDGIKKTASGLLYKVIKDGDGATPSRLTACSAITRAP